MERAKALLENTSLPISELMLLVGFEDLSSFSNFFKHYSGYNPKVFRRTFGTQPLNITS
jgi:AraC-like DNA-binding protein